MKEHTVILTIKKDGTLSSEVKGVSGTSCTTLSSWVDQLGIVAEDKHTDDYYKPDSQEVNDLQNI